MSLMLSRRTKLGAGAAAPFSPDQIAGLQLWLKADSLSLADGDPVGTWADSSVNARNATQSTAAKKPVYKTNIINGKPVVRFDGVDDAMQLPTMFQGAASIFMVSRQVVAVPASSYWTLLTYKSATPKFCEMLLITDPAYKKHTIRNDMVPGSTLNAVGYDPDLTLTTPRLVSWLFDGVTTDAVSSYSAYHDGVAQTVAQSGALGREALHVGSIGARLDENLTSTLHGNIDFGEIILYNSVLSTADRVAVENHLKTKYGIA